MVGLLAAIGLGVTFARPAFAQKPDTAAAEALFEEGRKLNAAGNTAAACEKFAESQRMAPSAGAALNLGVCMEKQNKIASAWAAFMEASALSMQAGQAEREKFARDRANALAPRISKVVIKVTNAPADLVVKRDGIAMTKAQWNVPIPVDAGEHTLEASAPKKLPSTKSFTISGEGTSTEVIVPDLADAPVEAPKTQTTTIEDNGKALRIIGIGSAIVGAGLLVTGGIFASSASSKENELNELAGQPNATWDPDRQTTYDDGESAATLASVFLISGGVLLAAGGVMTVLGFAAKKSTTTGLVVLPGGVRCAF